MKQWLGDTESWRGGKWRRRKRGEGEMSKMHCRHASDPGKAHTHTHEHTNNPNPVLCSSNERAPQHTNEHGQVVEAHSVNAPKPSQAVSGKTIYIYIYIYGVKPRKEYLALPSGVRGLEEKKIKRRGTERETVWTTTARQYLQLYCHYACFARWQTMIITLRVKLPWVRSKSFLLKQANG